ncbi:MAG: OsmC family protein [Anaerolineales bacterium]|nr:OsmC family protein [Anaerolineales bacterium]
MDMEITFPGGAKVDATFGEFTIKTDQSVNGGGNGSAPTPFSLFLASIGTCAGIYVSEFCQKRDIPTDNIKIRQSLQVNPMNRMVEQINLDIDLPADFPERYRSAIVKSAGLCAVKKHLEHPPEFVIETHIAAD